MKDDDNLEALVRDSMRRHEHLADGAGARLMPAVQAGVRRRPQRATWVAAVAGVALAVGAVPVGIALLGDDHGAPTGVGSPSTELPTSPSVLPSTDPPSAPPDGWRWESSRGLQLAVPQEWTLDDFGCNMTGAATMVRAGGSLELCLTPEPPTKEVAMIDDFGGWVDEDIVLERALLDSPTREEIVLDGLPAVKFTGTVAGDRHAVAVVVPDRGASVIVRTRSAQTTDAIIDSVRVVDHDHVGCSWRRPAVADSSRGGDLVDPAPSGISICFYGQFNRPSPQGELIASAQITGDSAAQLAGLLNASAPGGNPDVPPTDCLGQPQPPDVVLHVRGQDAAVHDLWISYSGCLDRGVTDGVSTVQVTQRIVHAVMGPLHVSFGFSGGLPE